MTAKFKTIENFAQRSSSEFYLFVFAKLTEKGMPMMGSTISVSLVAGCISSAQNPEVEREPRFSNVLNLAVKQINAVATQICLVP